ncbi:ubiquitin-conjugating enzyme/RWD-like protein [Boeremia exigua]|uniref:ubiquitin-conjugating enzyme/RWD-like protein n=1 Tax=Boeremia exigua TaxID=749465 RepID=UPI001E8D5E57|nr:ubiquitin-conjugating enzyme/RWD-like protein [Boeremia exigua]KAH6622184.1 ubiquitin-conjugating enzyme/RWD-like protein [Boeremia exigua]
MADAAQRVLMNEFKALSKETWTNIELMNDNVFEWSVALIVLNPDSLYYGGYFKAKMTFPRNYPHSPPDFRFARPLYHPNIYPDGRLCISILHPPGDDEMSGELAAERWSPVQRAETVLLSILSLLDDAETSSPANVDAGVMLRNQPEQYKAMVTKDTEASKADIPADFVMPTHETAWKRKEEEGDFEMSWEDSDVESFGGSESDFDEEMDSDFEGDEDEDEDDK